jgi:tetratricopeptide (TPR) repeat protein
VGKPLLVEYYDELPQPTGARKRGAAAEARLQAALEEFKSRVQARYNEGTLQRLLDSPGARARRAAVLALGLAGTMKSNALVASMLRDEDRGVRHLAGEALWSLWFRAGSEAQNQELRRLAKVDDPEQGVAGLSALIKKAPHFAEAYNQRAILYFRLGDYQRSVGDCETVVKLNPCHFGAQAGLGQGYMKLRKPRAALRAFRNALQINPGLDGVQETIQYLEEALGEEGKKDDKK